MISLTLFGEVKLKTELGETGLGSSKLEALLAVLAASGGKPLPREALADMLWGSRFDEQARQSLRQALSRLRKILGAEVLLSAERFVRLRTDILVSDLAEFDSLCNSRDADSLRQAAALSNQEFLTGLQVREPGFTEWLFAERRRIAGKRRHIALHLARFELTAGDAEGALATIESLLKDDPIDEEAHRLKLVILNTLGRKAEALRAHQSFTHQLKTQLDAAPAQETDELASRLRAPASPPEPDTPIQVPSLLVLPFSNLGGNDQDYFAEGMVEELIIVLSRIHWLTVLSRTSTFSERALSTDARRAGADFGVRYVLEGSIRRSGSVVRIMSQLIDTASGAAIWTERFEETLKNVFELQDRVATKVVGALQPRLERAEIDRSRRKPTASLDAYDHYLRGLSEVHRWSRAANRQALDHFYQAIRLDPRFATAYGMAARCYSQRKTSGWVENEEEERAETERLAGCAIEFGNDDPVPLSSAGLAVAFVGCRVREGGSMIERALALNPGLASGWLYSGWVNAWSGNADKAISCIDRAIELSPHDPFEPAMRRAIAFAHFIAGRYEQALELNQTVTLSPQNASIATATSAAAADILGRSDLARAEVSRLRHLEPRLGGASLRVRFPIVLDEDFSRFARALERAGLPA